MLIVSDTFMNRLGCFVQMETRILLVHCLLFQNLVEVDEECRIRKEQCPHRLNEDMCVQFVRKKVITGEHAWIYKLHYYSHMDAFCVASSLALPALLLLCNVYHPFYTSLNKYCTSIP